MEKAKFWLIQIVMVAFVGMVFGSPVMAHGDRGHKWGKKWSERKAYKAEKKDARYHKKMERKIKREEYKFNMYKEKLSRLEARELKNDDHKHSKKWNRKLVRKIKREKRKMVGHERKLLRYKEIYARHMETHNEVVPPPAEELPPVPDTCDDGYELQGDPAQCELIQTGPTCAMVAEGWVMGPGGVWPDNCIPGS